MSLKDQFTSGTTNKATSALSEAASAVQGGAVAAAVSAVQSLVGGPDILPQVRFSFEADTTASSWGVREVTIEESVSGLFECSVELKSEAAGADPEDLEGASCVLQIDRGGAVRRLCGVVTRVDSHGWMAEYTLARVTVRPALALLGLTQDSRIFQSQSASDILQAVLSAGLSPYQRTVRLNLSKQCAPREYCTQYQESDLDFALRLMAEEGIFFFFDHAGEREELVLVDANTSCPEHPSPIAVVAKGAPGELLSAEAIFDLRFRSELQPTDVVVVDHDWTSPDVDLTEPPKGTAPEQDALGRARRLYHHPSPIVFGDYDQGSKRYTRNDSRAFRTLGLERVRSRARLCLGESNVTGLTPGMVIEVSGHGGPGKDGKYLVTSVTHHGDAADQVHFQMNDVQGTRDRYRNRFTCTPIAVPYRPAARLRPSLVATQTATVVGPAGEEIFTDEHGRIKVQFHWDHDGKKDEHSSCFVRVAQVWGGSGWGFLFVPRIGMEVVVQFLNGEPDRPLVTGCVYNGSHPPPSELPAKKTVSTIKTSSSKGGNGSNELRFEDAAGSEEVYLHAQKDLKEVVEKDHSTSVGGSQSISVSGDQSTSITGNQSVTIQGKGSGAVHSTVNVTGKHSLDASDTIELQAPTHLKLTCGGSSILIEPGKITLMAGDGSQVVLDANALVQSSQGSKVFLDPNALAQSSAGAKTLHDDNVLSQSVAGSKVLLDANALTQSSQGAKTTHDANVFALSVAGASVLLDADASMMAPGNCTVQAVAKSTVAAMTSTVTGAGGSVEVGPTGVSAAGGKVSIAGGMVDVAGGLVKIN